MKNKDKYATLEEAFGSFTRFCDEWKSTAPNFVRCANCPCVHSTHGCFVSWLFEEEDAPRMLNKLAREEMKELVMRDILCDMAVCEIEGWDKLEYLDDLIATVTRLRTGKGEV